MKRVGTCVECRQEVGLTPGLTALPHYPPSIRDKLRLGMGMLPKEHHDGTLKAAPPTGLRETLEAISELAEGRRHYDDGGFEALGEAKDMADKALEGGDVLDDETCCGQAGRTHTWGAWTAYDEHVFDGTFRYRRECLILGCNARQKVEDLEPMGEVENLEPSRVVETDAQCMKRLVGTRVDLAQTTVTFNGVGKRHDLPPGRYAIEWAGGDRFILRGVFPGASKSKFVANVTAQQAIKAIEAKAAVPAEPAGGAIDAPERSES